MSQHKCDACGLEYSDPRTCTSCPRCDGQGVTPQECICIHLRKKGDLRIGKPTVINSVCPVHGDEVVIKTLGPRIIAILAAEQLPMKPRDLYNKLMHEGYQEMTCRRIVIMMSNCHQIEVTSDRLIKLPEVEVAA